MTLTVHHLSDSQSERVVWLCEELGLPYELRRYQREESMAAPPEYKALHPCGTAPVITDGDLVLSETGAIVEYICRKHAGGQLLLGPDDPDFADFLFWFHFANGSMIPAFMMEAVAKRIGAPPSSARLDTAFAVAERRLGEVEWFAGSRFTAADIMMVYPISRGRTFLGRDLSGFPNSAAYLARVAERPAYHAAVAKAEPERVAG